MIRNRFLTKFIGFDRFNELLQSLNAESASDKTPALGSGAIFLAVIVAMLPSIFGALGSSPGDVDITTVLVGTAAVISVIFRNRVHLRLHLINHWRVSLKLIHTAFALGCVPALMLVLFHPEALYILSEPSHAQAQSGQPMHWWYFVLQVSIWAGLTEEIIYRGLLLSVLRRWSAIPTQRLRDIFAIILSATIFGLGHMNSWGPAMSFALVGLGIGLGLGYVAIGERLLPVIVYHIVFDALSLTCAIFSYRA